MSPEELEARIDAANDKVIVADDTPTTQPPVPVDTYQIYADMAREYSRKRFPNGARPEYRLQAERVLNDLQGPYMASKARVESLIKHGDRGRAEMLKRQYMQEHYMPAVDALVMLGSADELLAMGPALEELDKMTMPDGNVSGAGYTEALVRSMYDSDLGKNGSKSDAKVRDCVRNLRRLTDAGNIRAAVGEAQKMLRLIEAGQNSADDADYALISKVAVR